MLVLRQSHCVFVHVEVWTDPLDELQSSARGFLIRLVQDEEDLLDEVSSFPRGVSVSVLDLISQLSIADRTWFSFQGSGGISLSD